jgi:hypothetical protein
MKKCLVLIAFGCLLGAQAFAEQKFVLISGTATMDESTYKISGEVVNASEGLDLAELKKISLVGVRFAIPPHIAITVTECPGNTGEFLVGTNGGDVFQRTARREINDGWENLEVVYEFTCAVSN